jgi:F-type H+-transporting ATPase subunit delta
MSLRTVARRYAGALFDVAHKNGSLDRAERQLATFGQLLDGHAELRRVLDTPALAAVKKRAILDALLAKVGEEDIGGEVRQLLRMLADRDRLALFPEIAAGFAERMRQSRRVQRAEITTAVPLPEGQRASLAEALKRAAGSDLTITEKVDPAIIGGVVARVGSLVFDGSVTRQLEKMRQKMLQET